jgi:hypothetical protein
LCIRLYPEIPGHLHAASILDCCAQVGKSRFLVKRGAARHDTEQHDQIASLVWPSRSTQQALSILKDHRSSPWRCRYGFIFSILLITFS